VLAHRVEQPSGNLAARPLTIDAVEVLTDIIAAIWIVHHGSCTPAAMCAGGVVRRTPTGQSPGNLN
jgi:hypothetical protein